MNQYKNVPTEALLIAHASGMKDRELSSVFEVHVSTIKRWKKRLRLGSNDARNNIGSQGERLLFDELVGYGFTVEQTPKGHDFDLQVNGHRVEVKTSVTSRGGSYRFRLNERRASHHAQYRYQKDYRQDSDVIALVIVKDTGIEHLYLMPSTLWQPSITIHPSSVFCPYAPYLWAVELLREAVAA